MKVQNSRSPWCQTGEHVTSSTTTARETTRDSTTSCWNARHHQRTWTAKFIDVDASLDYSAPTIAMPREPSAHYSHPTGCESPEGGHARHRSSWLRWA